MLLSVEKDLVRARYRLTGDQITQSGVPAFLNGSIEADVVAAVAHQVEHPLRLEIHLSCDLFDLRIAAKSPFQSPAYSTDLIDLLRYVYRKPHDPALLGDATADGLPYPPRAVRGELESLGVVELLDSPD